MSVSTCKFSFASTASEIKHSGLIKEAVELLDECSDYICGDISINEPGAVDLLKRVDSFICDVYPSKDE